MACPALPLCGLAVTEAERGLPDINRRIRAMLDKVGGGFGGSRALAAHSAVSITYAAGIRGSGYRVLWAG